jgi:hypothetical protein
MSCQSMIRKSGYRCSLLTNAEGVGWRFSEKPSLTIEGIAHTAKKPGPATGL